MKLLIIDDNPAITVALKHSLGSSFTVQIAETGADGLHDALTNVYHAIVLDLQLPDMNGLDVCRNLRAEHITTPILILSGELAIRDKVALLDAGADDYVTKPFSLEELKARLRVLSRRPHESASTSVLRVGDLSLDSATRQVNRGGTLINLRRKEFDILEFLMLRAGMAVARDAILDHVWNSDEVIWTNAVDVHIKYLRDKVDRPFSDPLIQTVHGIGYKVDVSKPVARV